MKKDMVMGNLIRQMRMEQGMTQEVLAEDICTASYLSRVENGSQIPSRRIYQLLMERLGESGSFYDHEQEEREVMILCCRLLQQLQLWQVEHVDEQLWRLRMMETAEEPQVRQFYRMASVIWHYMSRAITKEQYLDRCADILAETVSAEDLLARSEEDIRDLSKVEIWILNNLAIGYMWRREYKESLLLLYRLYHHLLSEKEMMWWGSRTKAVLCNNMAVCLLEIQKPKKAIEYCRKGLQHLSCEGGILLVLHILRVQMEAERMLADMEGYRSTRLLLVHLWKKMADGRGTCLEVENELWDRRELFVIF